MNERTRQAIVNSFNELLVKQEFETISVDMIVEHAGVSRATFYRYFKDKYEVMNANYKTILDYYVQPTVCSNYRDLYYHLFSVARRSQKTFKKAFTSTGINSFANFVYRYSLEIAEEITRANRNGKGFTDIERLQCDVYCYGISEMYKKWIMGQYKETTADEAADALYEMMPRSLMHYWW